MKDNLFYLLREYCLSKGLNCKDCLIFHTEDEDNGFRCRSEDIDDWSNDEIERYTKILLEWGKNNL